MQRLERERLPVTGTSRACGSAIASVAPLAVMTQLWVAMCMYLLLAYLKFVMRLRWSLHQMLQVLQLNMFERRPLQDLFTTPSLPAPSGSQLSLAWS